MLAAKAGGDGGTTTRPEDMLVRADKLRATLPNGGIATSNQEAMDEDHSVKPVLPRPTPVACGRRTSRGGDRRPTLAERWTKQATLASSKMARLAR